MATFMAIYSKGHLQYPVPEFLCFIFRFATHKKLKDVFFITLQPSSGPYFFCSKFFLSRPDSPCESSSWLLSFGLRLSIQEMVPPPPLSISGISSLLTFLAKRSRRCPVLSVTLDPNSAPGRLLPLGGGVWWQDDEKHLLRWPRHILAGERI